MLHATAHLPPQRSVHQGLCWPDSPFNAHHISPSVLNSIKPRTGITCQPQAQQLCLLCNVDCFLILAVRPTLCWCSCSKPTMAQAPAWLSARMVEQQEQAAVRRRMGSASALLMTWRIRSACLPHSYLTLAELASSDVVSFSAVTDCVTRLWHMQSLLKNMLAFDTRRIL